MKKLALTLVGILLMVGAVAAYQRMPESAFLVVLGGVLGVGAAIPMVLFALMVMTRQEQVSETNRRPEAQPRLSPPSVTVYNNCVFGNKVAMVGPPQLFRPEEFRHPQYQLGEN